MSGKGKRLEALVRKAAVSLADRQIARIYRWPEAKAVKMVPERCPCGRVSTASHVIHTEAPGADFWGFTTSGRVIMIECKECSKPSLAFNDSGLKPHQIAALSEVHRAGGIALLVWYRRKEIATIDLDVIFSISRGRKSIPWKKIPRDLIHPDGETEELLEPYLRERSPSGC